MKTCDQNWLEHNSFDILRGFSLLLFVLQKCFVMSVVEIDKFQLMTSLKMWRDNNRDNGDQKERSGCARAHKGRRDRNADSNLWIKSLQSSLRQSNRQEVAISPDGVQSSKDQN